MIEFLSELLFQIFGEALVDFAFHSYGQSERVSRTVTRVLIFGILGAAVGGLTIFIFPAHIIRDPGLRLASAVLTPFFAGTLFATVGRRRMRKGKHVSSLEAFWPAFAFALAMGAVRYFGAG